MKKVSIVIPSWFTEGQHGRHYDNETFIIANECLKRLIAVTPKELYELIIIDNGSTLVADEVSEYFSKADILIKNEVNKGFAPAINQGMAAATGEYVMPINNDVLIWEGFLEQMLSDFTLALSFTPPVGLLMPAIVKYNKYEKKFADVIKIEKGRVDMKSNAGRFSPGAEFGSCYLGKKEVFDKIAQNRDGYQVMDENFRHGYGEDRWLYREIRMLGMQTWRTHNTRVYHVGGVSMSKIKKQPGVREAIDKNREYLAELKLKHNIE